MNGKTKVVRCTWSEGIDPAYQRYHDTEWGVPVRDDRTHFEFLVLESAQAVAGDRDRVDGAGHARRLAELVDERERSLLVGQGDVQAAAAGCAETAHGGLESGG